LEEQAPKGKGKGGRDNAAACVCLDCGGGIPAGLHSCAPAGGRGEGEASNTRGAGWLVFSRAAFQRGWHAIRYQLEGAVRDARASAGERSEYWSAAPARLAQLRPGPGVLSADVFHLRCKFATPELTFPLCAFPPSCRSAARPEEAPEAAECPQALDAGQAGRRLRPQAVPGHGLARTTLKPAQTSFTASPKPCFLS